MPEGPTIVLMKEDLQKFEGEKVVSTIGNSGINNELLIN